MPPVFQPVSKVTCISFSDTKERKRNMRWCMHKNRGFKRITEVIAPGTDKEIAIVAGGPSLNKTYKEVNKFEYIMTCGSSHDHALRRGIKPTYHIECDPSLHQIKMYNEPSNAKYLISSRCHKSMFNKLKGRDIYLWHMWEADLGKPIYNSEPAFICGATVVLSAIPVALVMQFKRMHFFGFDSSFESREEHHAYPQPETAQMLSVKVGDPVTGREFQTTATWLGQAQQFEEMRNHWQFDATIYGDSLTAEMERTRKLAIQQKEMA